MKFVRLKFILLVVFLCSAAAFGQQPKTAATASGSAAAEKVKYTPAYTELVLRRTELESMLDEMAETFTEDYPKVKQTRYELGLIEKDLAKLSSLGSGDLSRLTEALGKLMVRRAELDANLWSLKTRLSDEHPDVVRARRRLSTFERAVKEILP